jgi:hypothetical protein
MTLAPLTGADERAALTAVGLLAKLALPGDGLVHGAAVDRLSVGDRDRALAALYGDLYGDRVLADARCIECGAGYEIRFRISDLTRSRQPDGSATGDPPAIMLGETRLRLPEIGDLRGDPADILRRLTLDGPVPDLDTAAAALEAADPALELDLSGTCPDCDTTQATPFSITRFLEAALARDSAFLMREVHLIASTYRWSFAEILTLSRVERQGFARLLIGEREVASQPMRRIS